jgi:hypothetical protein
MWQDIIITAIMILFAYALIPQIARGFRLKRKLVSIQTSLITFLGMYALAYIYFTLNLKFSVIVSLITGTLWLILFIQGITYKR